MPISGILTTTSGTAGNKKGYSCVLNRDADFIYWLASAMLYYSQVTYIYYTYEEKNVQHCDVTTHTRHKMKIHDYLCNILKF